MSSLCLQLFNGAPKGAAGALQLQPPAQGHLLQVQWSPTPTKNKTQAGSWHEMKWKPMLIEVSWFYGDVWEYMRTSFKLWYTLAILKVLKFSISHVPKAGQFCSRGIRLLLFLLLCLSFYYILMITWNSSVLVMRCVSTASLKNSQLMWCRLHVKVFILACGNLGFSGHFRWQRFKNFNEESLNRQSSMSWQHINCSAIIS